MIKILPRNISLITLFFRVLVCHKQQVSNCASTVFGSVVFVLIPVFITVCSDSCEEGVCEIHTGSCAACEDGFWGVDCYECK